MMEEARRRSLPTWRFRHRVVKPAYAPSLGLRTLIDARIETVASAPFADVAVLIVVSISPTSVPGGFGKESLAYLQTLLYNVHST